MESPVFFITCSRAESSVSVFSEPNNFRLALNSFATLWARGLVKGWLSLSKTPNKTPEKTAQIKINSLFQKWFQTFLIDENAETAASVGTK